MRFQEKQVNYLEYAAIIVFCALPLFMNFPYRINIFLSWEGAYRLSQGHIPFKDFGLPMGPAYWIIPAVFFKIFGPFLITLVKAQVFINLVAAFTFRSILKIFNLKASDRFLTLLLFCIVYILINFWPWYNNTVFVFQLVSLFFVLKGLTSEKKRTAIILLIIGAFFSALSFFTKQDGGGLAIMLNSALVLYTVLRFKQWRAGLSFFFSLGFFLALFIVPFFPYDFSYWFNYGQEPHYSRVSLKDFLDFLLGGSNWLKFYFVALVLIVAIRIHETGLKAFVSSRKEFIFFLLTLGILVQASIIQFTSYVPPDNNIYFHAFVFAFIIKYIRAPFDKLNLHYLAVSTLLILIWWSGMYYKYIDRLLARLLPAQEDKTEVVSVSTYRQGVQNIEDDENADDSMIKWVFLPEMKAFEKIYMPASTVEGIQRLKQMPVFKNNPKVLNMTELTPLAHELGFDLEKGAEIPLWYHLNVSMFDRELKMYKHKVENNYYDVVLYEYIPNLNNFYPFELREDLMKNYSKVDSFAAPRRHGGNPVIEVYIRKSYSGRL